MDEKQKTKAGELAAAATRVLFGALGAINPHLALVAPLMSEVVTSIIPRQRTERLEHLTEELAEQVSGIDEERVKQRFTETGFVDLLEDGLWQATRATSEERIKQIATLLKNGLSDEDVNALQYKTLLGLLGELNEAEIITLQYFAMDGTPAQNTFRTLHTNVLMPDLSHNRRSTAGIDKTAMREKYRAHLVQMGLLAHRYREPSRGGMPEMDYETGTVKPSSTDITRLGQYLLRTVGLIENNL